MAETITPLNLSAPDIVRYFESRNPRPIGHWDELGRDEYARSFTAARTAGFDVVDDLYFALIDTVESGGTHEDYSARVMPILKAKGWLEADDGALAKRVQLIYETNINVARGAGLWARVQRNKATLPYLRAATARDRRVRHPPKSPKSDHRAWDGICLPVDHPFWTRWWPPLGFRCRCSIIPMSRAQFARWGGGITSDGELVEREAELGRQIFVPPGAGNIAQLNAVAQAENKGPRMPGLPELSAVQERIAGANAWAKEVAAALAPARPAVPVVSRESLVADGVLLPPRDPRESFSVFNDDLKAGPREVLAEMLAGTGIETRTVIAQGSELGTRDVAAIKAELVRGTEAVGKIQRTFSRSTKGELTVSHDYLEIFEGVRDAGIAKAVFRNSLAIYERAGVKRIDVHAGLEVGGYAWARFGFVPRLNAWKGLRETIGYRLNALRRTRKVEDEVADAVEAMLKSDDPKTVWRIAALKYPVDDETLGKALLLKTDWVGAIDMEDLETMTVLRKYIGMES